MKTKAVVVLSGGMDSTTLLYDVLKEGREVFAISFSYGQNHTKEIDLAAATCRKLGVHHQILDIANMRDSLFSKSTLVSGGDDIPEGHYAEGNMQSTVVPNRNMILLALTTAFAVNNDCTEVYYGAHAGDHAIYPDCRKEFVDAMSKAIALCDYSEIQLIAPYWNLTKADIARTGADLGVDYSLTWSCYKGGKEACGKCGTCVERLEAMEEAGIVDPIEYEDREYYKSIVK